jgi:hypothetical protein
MRYIISLSIILVLYTFSFSGVIDDFKKSAKTISGRDSDIFSKDFIKRPNKYTGEQITFVGKIAKIEENENQTSIQVFINREYDLVIVYHKGSIDFYDGDIIRVYGVARGVLDGLNNFGVPMQWPLIESFIVEKPK